MQSTTTWTERGDLLDGAARAVDRAVDLLYARQRADGSWRDRLSSSAIATGSAVLALARAGRATYGREIETGLAWLRASQREDGGWSDADSDPPSDMAATAIALAALQTLAADQSARSISGGRRFLDARGGLDSIAYDMNGLGPGAAILWSLVGLRDPRRQPYLPMEVILLPRPTRSKLSIGMPAILGMGLMQSRVVPANPLRRSLQRLAEPRALAWLRSVQAVNGGIEECPVLAAFIYLGLEVAGVGEDIAQGCIAYLRETRREDGSWAVDRDLEIAVTTFAVMALAECRDPATEPRLRNTRGWLVSTQWRDAFAPLDIPAGGWSWAMPSGWPETDDTATVLTALGQLGLTPAHPTVSLGIDWLHRMQNRNGSWSEWVRNSTLLMDRPCPAVTAQALMVLRRFGDDCTGRSPGGRAVRYLRAAQLKDGAVPSLWFRNHVYGTSRFLEAWADLGREADPAAARASAWLRSSQRQDGGWPAGVGPEDGTVEETAWALYALLRGGAPPWDEQVARAVQWLVERQNGDGSWPASPVGLYFFGLRYSNDCIADTYAIRALARWLRCARPAAQTWRS